MAKKTKPSARKTDGNYSVYLNFQTRDFKKLSAEKQKAFLKLADRHFNPVNGIMSFTFKRDAWFATCGEVYALLVGNVPFSFQALTDAMAKGGA